MSLRALTGPYCCQLSLPPSLSKLQAPIAARRLIWLPSSQPSRPALQSLISVVSSIRPSIHSWIRCCALFLARISRPCAGAESNRIVSWARKVTDQWVSVATLGLQALPQSGPSTRPPPTLTFIPSLLPCFQPSSPKPSAFPPPLPILCFPGELQPSLLCLDIPVLSSHTSAPRTRVGLKHHSGSLWPRGTASRTLDSPKDRVIGPKPTTRILLTGLGHRAFVCACHPRNLAWRITIVPLPAGF